MNAAARREWKSKNPEKVRASNARWCAANPEKVAAYHAAYCARNPEKRRAKDVAYRAANKEKRAAAFAKWYAKNRKRPEAPIASSDGRPVVTRDGARGLGLQRYFTGRPCKNGHISERRVSSTRCLACHAAYGVRYRASPAFNEAPREKSRLRTAEWRNSAAGKAWTSRYTVARWSQKKTDPEFLDKQRAAVRAWQRANPDKKKSLDAAWRLANKDKPEFKEKQRVRALNRIALKRAAVGNYSIADVRSIYGQQDGLCACGCGSPLDGGKFHIDHIVPLSRGGSNWPANIQLLSPQCNLSKSRSTMEEWNQRRQPPARAA